MHASVRITAVLAALIVGLPFAPAHAQSSGPHPDLGSAKTFAVLGASTVTNTGASQLFGNVGVSPGTAITGFPPATIRNGAIYAGGPVAVQAQKDVALTYADLAGRTYIPANDMSGEDLGGLTLGPGVYHFGTSALLTGQLTFDARGDRNAFFIVQIGTTLTTASNSSVKLIGGANQENVFWQAGSSVTLGANTAMQGNVLVYTSITTTTGATVLGRLLAENGAVTLDTNIVATNLWQVADIAAGVDNKARILWNTPSGALTLASLDNNGKYGFRNVGGPRPGWSVPAVACGDDGLTRLLWSYRDGRCVLWLVNADNAFEHAWGFPASAGWTAVDISVGHDNRARILRTNVDGRMMVWSVNNIGHVTAGPILNANPGWTATRIACGPDGLTRVLWANNADGGADVWLLNANNSFKSDVKLSPNTEWTAMDISMGADNKMRLLWTNADEAMMCWTVGATGAFTSTPPSNPDPMWTAVSLAAGADNLTRVLWAGADGTGRMWLMNDNRFLNSFTFHR